MKNPIFHSQSSFVSEDGMGSLAVNVNLQRSVLVPAAMLEDEETKEKFIAGLYEGLDAQMIIDLENKINEIKTYQRWKKSQDVRVKEHDEAKQ